MFDGGFYARNLSDRFSTYPHDVERLPQVRLS